MDKANNDCLSGNPQNEKYLLVNPVVVQKVILNNIINNEIINIIASDPTCIQSTSGQS